MPPPFFGEKTLWSQKFQQTALNIPSDSPRLSATAYPVCGRRANKVILGDAGFSVSPLPLFPAQRIALLKILPCGALRPLSPHDPITMCRPRWHRATSCGRCRTKPNPVAAPVPRQRRSKGLDAPADGTALSVHPTETPHLRQKQERRRHPRCHRPFFGEKVFGLKGSS